MSFQKVISKKIEEIKNFFCWHLENHEKRAESGSGVRSGSGFGSGAESRSVIKCTDPRIRIHTKM
jgi:hypothetical protein